LDLFFGAPQLNAKLVKRHFIIDVIAVLLRLAVVSSTDRCRPVFNRFLVTDLLPQMLEKDFP